MIDNAKYHRSKYMSDFYEQLKIPHLFLGPYQFDMAPIEKLFAFIKKRNLNLFKTRTQQRTHLECFLKEVAVLISKLDLSWINGAFINCLIAALNNLSLRNI